MCIGGCEVAQTKLWTGCGWFSVNSLLASLFICSPFSKAPECQGCCGYFLWILSLPIRIPVALVFMVFGLLIDIVNTLLWMLTLGWCCGKCKEWSCADCCQTKKKFATDCLLEVCACEVC